MANHIEINLWSTHLEKRSGGHFELQSEHFLDDERLAVNQLGHLAALVFLGPA